MIVLVEDMLSATKLNQLGIRSVCLLGTNINDNLVNRLLELNEEHVVLALDKDATAKAVKLSMSIGYLFKKFTVLPLEKDIKDMTSEEISSVL